MTVAEHDATDMLAAAEDMLSALWARAMNNDATADEIQAIRHGCAAIAIAKFGRERVGLFQDWRNS